MGKLVVGGSPFTDGPATDNAPRVLFWLSEKISILSKNKKGMSGQKKKLAINGVCLIGKIGNFSSCKKESIRIVRKVPMNFGRLLAGCTYLPNQEEA